MNFSFLSKDPAMLSCPCCREVVNCRLTWRDLRQKKRIVCTTCQTPLQKHSKNYFAIAPIALYLIVDISMDLKSPWYWLLPLLMLGLSLYLTGKEIQSTRLKESP